MSIGNRIRESRKTKKMTQEALADATGLSQMSVRRYESDDRMPPADIAARIATALGVDVNYLLWGQHAEEKSELVIDMTEEEIREMLQMLQTIAQKAQESFKATEPYRKLANRINASNYRKLFALINDYNDLLAKYSLTHEQFIDFIDGLSELIDKDGE